MLSGRSRQFISVRSIGLAIGPIFSRTTARFPAGQENAQKTCWREVIEEKNDGMRNGLEMK